MSENNEISSQFKEAILDIKSKPVYDKWWSRYNDFKIMHSHQNNSISVFLDFIKYLAEDKKVSTIWQAASCINKFLQIDYNISHITNPLFKAYMKQLSKSYVPKKSDVFSMHDVEKYMRESDKTTENLSVKVCMIIGLYGALRISELTYLHFDDVKSDGANFKVIVRQSKTDQAGIGHEFMIPPSPVADICPCRHIEAYINLFSVKEGRLFRKFSKEGKPLAQVIGVNSMANYPKKVAEFLGMTGLLVLLFLTFFNHYNVSRELYWPLLSKI